MVKCQSLSRVWLFVTHGILQASILEWVAIPFPRGSSQPGIKPRSPAFQADSLLWNSQSWIQPSIHHTTPIISVHTKAGSTLSKVIIILWKKSCSYYVKPHTYLSHSTTILIYNQNYNYQSVSTFFSQQSPW